MIYTSMEMAEKAVLEIASLMCAAARTAPKATGRDTIFTMVLTGEEKEALAMKMEEIGETYFSESALLSSCALDDFIRINSLKFVRKRRSDFRSLLWNFIARCHVHPIIS